VRGALAPNAHAERRLPAGRYAGILPAALAENDLHIWTCTLPEDITPLTPLLSPDEHTRATRFRFDLHRRRFIAARATLRQLLAAYINKDPKSLRFLYEPLGKPRLADGEVSFNLSHCDDRLMLAIRKSGEVGIDVERIRPVADAEQIAATFFPPEEAEPIRSAAEPERSQLFLRHWTRHEARGKYLGRGLVEDTEFHQITMLDLPTQDGHLAAVAVEYGLEDLRCQEFRL
jgi:4'-phosphopantetheinyl transferase